MRACLGVSRTPFGRARWLRYLSEDNRPIYFRQFAERAAASGLRYVADANHPLMHLDNLSPGKVRRRLLSFGGDRIAVEQSLDYLRGRLFRQSILCRAEHDVRWVPDSSLIQRLHLAANIKLQPWPYPLADALPDRPIASPHARYEAAGSRMVTNLCHERVELADDIVRRTLTLLDGARSPADIKVELGLAEGEVDAAIRMLAESALLRS